MKAFSAFKRKHLIFPLFLILLTGSFLFVFRSCHPESEDTRFEKYIEKIFREEMQTNTLNLHYTLAYPEDYGIQDYEISLGTMEPEALEKSLKETEKFHKILESFDPSGMSRENQILYDILSLEFSSQVSLGSSYLLQEPLGPNLGIQAQLPILLSEYTFRTSADIKDYFSLLAQLPDYFQGILEFERKKAEEGLFMSDTSADRIIQQCQSFMETGRENYLCTMFQQRVDELLDKKQISSQQAESFIQMHEKLMDQFVFPAYLTLSQGLEKLKGQGKNSGGLVYLENGKDYYKYLISTGIGSPLAPEEIRKQIEDQLKENRISLLSLLQQNPNILQEYEQASCPITEPQDILSTLQQEIEKDFPKPPNTSYELKTVDPSLSEHLSPAFYLTPPVDEVFSNVIYINSLSSSYNAQSLYPTLAHEGYPGHLYQNTYFYSTNPNPIRSLLNFSGYSEGWATYVEYHCYEDIDYGTSSSDIAKLQQYEMDLSLGICSLVDIGVNYDGWTLDECSVFLKENGIDDNKTILSLYYSVIEEPSNYLRYYSSFLQFENLRTLAKNELKENFDLKEFHKTILNLGPAPFPIVEQTIKEQLNIS